MATRPRIVVDAMGGDKAPTAVIAGAINACRETGAHIILAGDEKTIRNELTKLDGSYLPITILHAPDVIAMGDDPVSAVKKMKHSSIRIGLECIKDAKADVFLSAGNSGAVVSAALLILKRVRGVDRPAIAPLIPSSRGPVIIIDAGATSVCRPHNLVQFAVMAAAYSTCFLKCESPRVSLLSNGEEETKGTEIVRSAHALLKDSGLHYVGYVEGKDVFQGHTDIVVCDGFTGNILLKAAEGVAEALGASLNDHVRKSLFSRIGFIFSRRVFTRLKKKFDYTEYGGAPLLGVSAPVIIAHGRSTPRAIQNAIRTAEEFAQAQVVDHVISDAETNPDLLITGRKPSLIDRVLRDMHLRRSDEA